MVKQLVMNVSGLRNRLSSLRKGAFDRPIFPRSKGSHSVIGPIPIYGVLAHSMIAERARAAVS